MGRLMSKISATHCIMTLMPNERQRGMGSANTLSRAGTGLCPM